ncbi:hypothetical protein, partial [Sphingobacterium daejeonense]|uniref:hypothetical protein n=1 Tax=Sphingobacterium daejeonense TaxID=371142 RepID=UPI003D319901
DIRFSNGGKKTFFSKKASNPSLINNLSWRRRDYSGSFGGGRNNKKKKKKKKKRNKGKGENREKHYSRVVGRERCEKEKGK